MEVQKGLDSRISKLFNGWGRCFEGYALFALSRLALQSSCHMGLPPADRANGFVMTSIYVAAKPSSTSRALKASFTHCGVEQRVPSISYVRGEVVCSAEHLYVRSPCASCNASAVRRKTSTHPCQFALLENERRASRTAFDVVPVDFERKRLATLLTVSIMQPGPHLSFSAQRPACLLSGVVATPRKLWLPAQCPEYFELSVSSVPRPHIRPCCHCP